MYFRFFKVSTVPCLMCFAEVVSPYNEEHYSTKACYRSNCTTKWKGKIVHHYLKTWRSTSPENVNIFECFLKCSCKHCITVMKLVLMKTPKRSHAAEEKFFIQKSTEITKWQQLMLELILALTVFVGGVCMNQVFMVGRKRDKGWLGLYWWNSWRRVSVPKVLTGIMWFGGILKVNNLHYHRP